MNYIAENETMRYEMKLDRFTDISVNLTADMKRRFKGLATIFYNIDRGAYEEVAGATQALTAQADQECENDRYLQELLADEPTEENEHMQFPFGHMMELPKGYRSWVDYYHAGWKKKVDSIPCMARLNRAKELADLWMQGAGRSLGRISVEPIRRNWKEDRLPNLPLEAKA